MTENYSKSKLKRKKPSVEEHHVDISSRVQAKTLFSGNSTAKTDGSSAPAAAWWNRPQLPPVENLWALTLKCALPNLEDKHWDLVPDLPHPSAPTPTVPTLDELWWSDHIAEVAPIPEPSPPSCPSPDPFRLSSSQQDLPVQTIPVSDPLRGHVSSHSSPKRKTTSLRLSVHNWEETASSKGPLNTRGEAERRPVSEQLPTELVDSSVQKKGTSKEEEQRRVAGDGGTGGGGLKSCPMCLLVFPVGFTQMDCDSHLAQCLSEMNVDMTW